MTCKNGLGKFHNIPHPDEEINRLSNPVNTYTNKQQSMDIVVIHKWVYIFKNSNGRIACSEFSYGHGNSLKEEYKKWER